MKCSLKIVASTILVGLASATFAMVIIIWNDVYIKTSWTSKSLQWSISWHSAGVLPQMQMNNFSIVTSNGAGNSLPNGPLALGRPSDDSSPKSTDWMQAVSAIGMLFLSVIVTSVGLLQYRVSQEQMLITKRQAKIADKQADIMERQTANAQIALDLEGPYLHPRIGCQEMRDNFEKFCLYEIVTTQTHIRPSIKFNIKNVGRSTAILHSVAAELICGEAEIEMPWSDLKDDYNVEQTIDPGDTDLQEISRVLKRSIDQTDLRRIQSHDLRIFLIGRFNFSDLPGAPYLQNFCFIYDWNSNKFVRWGREFNKRVRLEWKRPFAANDESTI